MSVLYILVPVALGIVLFAVGAFVWSVRSGQFDDLDTPGLRPLIDEDRAARAPRKTTAAGIAKSASGRQIS